jgi:hypothetical protein
MVHLEGLQTHRERMLDITKLTHRPLCSELEPSRLLTGEKAARLKVLQQALDLGVAVDARQAAGDFVGG